jgi:methylenetetrahydrofolate reductase (NADPH)
VSIQGETAGSWNRRRALGHLVRNISYEVMPLKNAERSVLDSVPTTIPLTVTVTEARGIDATVQLAERLAGQGYTVAPHLPARQFVDTEQLRAVVDRLGAAGVRSVVVVGGDVLTPAGRFQDSYSLLQAMESMDHPFTEIGIGGYPEGHATIPQQAIDLALKQKSALATHIITQICFDAATTISWAAEVAACGTDLPVHVGVPGPVSRQRLVRISAAIGLGQSARFLHRQHGMLLRLFQPGGYRPTKLVRRLGAALPRTRTNIAGLHIFTFNELSRTESWRQELLASTPDRDDR